MTAKAARSVDVPPPLPKGRRRKGVSEAFPPVWRNGAWRSPEAVERIVLRERQRQRDRRAAGTGK